MIKIKILILVMNHISHSRDLLQRRIAMRTKPMLSLQQRILNSQRRENASNTYIYINTPRSVMLDDIEQFTQETFSYLISEQTKNHKTFKIARVETKTNTNTNSNSSSHEYIHWYDAYSFNKYLLTQLGRFQSSIDSNYPNITSTNIRHFQLTPDLKINDPLSKLCIVNNHNIRYYELIDNKLV